MATACTEHNDNNERMRRRMRALAPVWSELAKRPVLLQGNGIAAAWRKASASGDSPELQWANGAQAVQHCAGGAHTCQKTGRCPEQPSRRQSSDACITSTSVPLFSIVISVVKYKIGMQCACSSGRDRVITGAPRERSRSDEQRVCQMISAGAVEGGDVVLCVRPRWSQCVRAVRSQRNGTRTRHGRDLEPAHQHSYVLRRGPAAPKDATRGAKMSHQGEPDPTIVAITDGR
jgi:hypothetical protein